MNRLIKYKALPRNEAERQISKLTTIATVLGLKDPYTRKHARRVAIYAGRLAERIGLNATEVENIRLGGLLHDVGKIALSTKVLNNTHKQLTDNMLAEVRQHPQRGVAILKEFDLPGAVIDIVRYHHENMDGSGYPFGLKSFQIPLSAKIIRVADCFDAITTDRPYQQRKSWIEALAILRQFSGTELNPMLVRAFIADIKENGLALNPARSISLYSPVFDRRLMESAINGLGE
ncbi:MAG: HD domain-containing protein [Desulfobacterales bacterium]|nr:HD domain-containing protein [Desulfobacterales bacterium]MDH4011830.1 HD domain-containing protein [Desulfobacterales bacterium]